MRKLDLRVPYPRFLSIMNDIDKCQLSPPPPSLKIVPTPLLERVQELRHIKHNEMGYLECVSNLTSGQLFRR